MDYFVDPRESESVSDDDFSSSSSDNEDTSNVRGDKDNDEENVVVRLSWKPSTGPISLGEWEEHTKVSALQQ